MLEVYIKRERIISFAGMRLGKKQWFKTEVAINKVYINISFVVHSSRLRQVGFCGVFIESKSLVNTNKMKQ